MTWLLTPAFVSTELVMFTHAFDGQHGSATSPFHPHGTGVESAGLPKRAPRQRELLGSMFSFPPAPHRFAWLRFVLCGDTTSAPKTED